MRSLFCLSLLAFAACRHLPVPADASASAMRAAGATSSGAFDLAHELSTQHPARITGSPNEQAAQQWAVAKMKSLGFDDAHLQPVDATGWFRADERVLLNGTTELHAAAIGLTPPTPGDGVEGDVVEVDDTTAAAAADGPPATGKIIFWNNAPMKRTTDFSGYGGAVRVRRTSADLCGKLGALGVVFRSVTSADDDFAHTGWGGQSPPCPTFALSAKAADTLHQAVAAGTARLSLRSHGRTEPVKTANVIGEVRGRTRPAEVVLLAAHLDSWDLGAGAVDDAAGVGIVLEVARLVAALPQRPERTLRVVLFTNEEAGSAGSRAYAKEHGTDQHIAGIEADSGTDEVVAIAFRTADDARARAKKLADALEGMNIAVLDEPAHGGADLGALTTTPFIDLRQRVDRYFDFHHTAADQPSALNPTALAQITAAYAAIVTQLLSTTDVYGPVAPKQ